MKKLIISQRQRKGFSRKILLIIPTGVSMLFRLLEPRRVLYLKLTGLRMYLEQTNNRVVIIVGPTAVGKTRLSIRLAQSIDGEIVSADSRYIYRGMDIGSAKPTITERKGIPHHMIDIADPDETWSLAKYFDKSRQKIEEILARRHVPIIVGGTGQYIRALTEGWTVPAMEPNLELRTVLGEWAEEIGPQDLYHKLGVIDKEACAFIDPSNVRRTIRALEVIFTTGNKFSMLRSKNPPKNEFWIIGLTLPRTKLYDNVDHRIDEMFRMGLVEEVKQLLKQGYESTLPSMSAIGYREVAQFIDGKITLDEVKVLMRRNTRKFIRRQANWFKPEDPSIHWYSVEDDPLDTIVRDIKENFLMKGKSQ